MWRMGLRCRHLNMDQKFIEGLISRMSLEEKVGQMTMLTVTSLIAYEAPGKPKKPITLKSDEPFAKYHIGGLLNMPERSISPADWRKLMRQIQEKAALSPQKIPVLYGLDSVHGANYVSGATLFSQPINQAASFNLELVEAAAKVSAYETRAAGVPLNFGPMLDVGRNPLWPRLWEGFGEDVYLCQQMGLASIKGSQGHQMGSPERIAACPKHFVGYSVPISGKDRTPAWIPERFLREYFLPPFKTAFEWGVGAVIINSSEVNGIPSHADPKLLQQILRKEMGFEGVAISDWQDIVYLHKTHRVSHNNRESVKMAVMAGIDLCMTPFDFSFTEDLVSLVRDGEVPMERIDQAVRRILQLKLDLGLFENPLPEPENGGYRNFGGKSSQEVSRALAEESLVLAKNDQQLLPLPPKAKILVTGPCAHSIAALNGGLTHTWQNDTPSEGEEENQPTIAEALEQRLGRAQLKYAPGTYFRKRFDIEEAMKMAADCDYVVACIGEEPYAENMGNINDLSLSEVQADLVKALAATHKPIILVLVEGRPRTIAELEPMADAIVMAFLPGNEGGNAIADLLLGKLNPSGKMPFTYPKYPNCLVTYDHKFSDEGHVDYTFEEYQPLFEFGTGLSYTDYTYSELTLSHTQLALGDSLEVSVKLKNVGKRKGKEVVQLYVRDCVASITPPVKRLRGFQKVLLQPGQAQTVKFQLHTADLAFVGLNNQWVTEPGKFEVMIGGLSADFNVVVG